MISDVISLIDFFDKTKHSVSTKSALFRWDGTKIEGDNEIQIVLSSDPNNSKIWFYKVKDINPYVFVYMPVIPSLFIAYGVASGEKNPDAKFFRFVASPMSKFTSGGEENVKVDFIVVGYKPKDLLNIKEK